jgi:hypothetical protein
MTTTAAPDLTTGFPRRGRTLLGGYAWLARLADKARAEQAGTEGEYVAYCGLSQGFLQAAGVSESDFTSLIREGKSDGDLVAYFEAHVDAEHKAAANEFILETAASHLDEQDAEERA